MMATVTPIRPLSRDEMNLLRLAKDMPDLLTYDEHMQAAGIYGRQLRLAGSSQANAYLSQPRLSPAVNAATRAPRLQVPLRVYAAVSAACVLGVIGGGLAMMVLRGMM